MMIHGNMVELKHSHFDLLERLYGISKDELLTMPDSRREELFFPDGDSPLWNAMQKFDKNWKPLPDTLIAEQICDILRPPSVYRPQPE